MISALDPRLWLAIIAVAIVSYAVGDYRATSQARTATQAESAIQLAADTTDTLETERLMHRSLAAKAAQYHKDLQNERTKHDRFVAGVRAGAIRLSIPVSACQGPESPDPAVIARSGYETRAQLTPEAGATLAAIASDGDEGIRQLNQCIDAYNTIRGIHVQAR